MALDLPDAPTAPTPPSARLAVPADLERTGELHRAAVAAIATARGGTQLAREVARPEPESELAEVLAEDGRHLLVGCLGPEVVGHAVLRTGAGATSAELEELWVEPAARGVGVGHALVELASDLARTAGCVGLDATALPGDRATKNFFEDHAMVARAIVVHRPLDPVPVDPVPVDPVDRGPVPGDGGST